ncbi:transporter substrate-binding domain-containing protein [Rhodobium gokarnense]|uniref:Polar amino acid transport system substrate-binding protein n=1 Tax=Rhodobium gokarnense TaxID=364296 RepID=A0ABT3H7Q2_9HYPH|nr:transporter substrate-binding domain-containing protein [Rhodobium gokarnense]MCW2306427.1 polar amino acid transport system substrate-binding protein [Rhodobium gokarnense]
MILFAAAFLALVTALPDAPARAQAPAAETPAAGDAPDTAAGATTPEAEKAEEPKPLEPRPPFEASGPVTIPNYWDPHSRPEKPDVAVRTIRFLTSDGFPPFNFVSSDGRLSGFNVELARAICEVLEAECTIQMRPFAELETALEEDRGDAIIAGLAMSAENRKALGFSDVYLRLPARFVARRDSGLEATPEGLADKWVATVANTAHEAFLHAFFRNSRIITYPEPQVAREALKAGEVDAFFGSALSLSFWLAGDAADGCCDFLGGAYLDPTYFGSGLSIAVARDNTALKAALDYALHRVHEEGRYGELYLRYFPVSFY